MSLASVSTTERPSWQRALLRLGAFLLVTAASVAIPTARAQPADEPRALSNLHHTAWTRKEGAPAPIPALAQTSDGWLWLGTPTGLYRFDGVRFERWAGVTRSVASLFVPPDGGLWIGYVGGGAAFMRNDELVQYGGEQGLPPRSVQSMAVDAEGTVWAAAVVGLYRFDGNAWSLVRSNTDASPLPTLNVVAARDGSIWARSGENIVRVAPRGRVAEVVAKAGTELHLAAAPDGSVWRSPGGPDHGLARLAPDPLVSDVQHRVGAELFFDRDGRLWSAVDGGVRMTEGLSGDLSPAGVEATLAQGRELLRTQGFTGRAPISLVHDREGVVWIGTERGLDRFRPTKLELLMVEDTASSAVVAGADGSVWVGRWNSPPVRVDGFVPRELPQGAGQSRGPRICAARDPAGVVWMCGTNNLWRIDGADVQAVAYPEDLPLSLYIQALAVGRDGTVWMVSAQGLHRRVQGAWQWMTMPELARLGLPNAMTVDREGRVLFGFNGGLVAVLEGERLQVVGPSQGLDVGDVKVITAMPSRYWVGGSQGVAVCEASRCRPLLLARHADLNGVSGIVESSRGDLWLNGAEGVTLIGARHLQAALEDPAHEPPFIRFDSDDGLDGTPSQIRPMGTAVEDTSGRVWFTTSTNVYSLDITRLPRNMQAPPVQIRRLQAGETDFGNQDGLNLPEWASRSVSISYTALSLAIPERVRFRYRLSGVDTGWRDAGGRREVFYTNLEPGAYRFDVVASNEDGVWNEQGASLAFSIEPAFHQTLLFKLLLAAAALWIAYALYVWRVRAIYARTRTRLEARMAERERIARDLHDTLLQGVQAVVLMLQSALEKIPREHPLNGQIGHLADRTQQVLDEGRDRVHELREAGHLSLHGAIEAFAHGVSREHPALRFHVRLSGAPRSMHPVAHDEAFNIVREAVFNAIAHAQATRVDVMVEFARKGVLLSVSDDGVGIDLTTFVEGVRPGHWGLVGMRERAAKIDARLDLRSVRGAGTTIDLFVPARVAYLRPRSLRERLRDWHVSS